METSTNEQIFITVKTYPNLSTKHVETVCTAGIRADGSWIRIYPIPYRQLKTTQRFSKYQWVEAEITRDSRDPRPESFKLLSELKPLAKIDTAMNWQQRKNLLLGNVYYDLARLIAEARDINNFKSLAIFKPARIINFHMEKDENLADLSRKRKAIKKQIGKEMADRLAEKVPYKFYYTIIDENGKRSKMQILDWEIYQLCRKLIRKYGRKKSLIHKALRQKYFDEFVFERDVFLFLGTNKHWHIRRSNNPFMIVGVFYPPKV